MPRPAVPSFVPFPSAYRVPWHVSRADPAHPLVINHAAEPADFVRVFRDDAGRDRTQLWGQVLPAEQIEVCLCAADLDEVIVTVAWFRQADGLEYVWRFVA
ncbi:hypothetical protein [Microbacterium sp. LWH10-1.2]|uniref:hypothetical protein n=1 Tax=unclassified Microbacterium TaxID=2609290 RepID=UPI00313904FA